MLLLNLSSTCFAIDLDELRWVKVYETDTDKCYIDTESVNFDDNLKRIFKCNKNIVMYLYGSMIIVWNLLNIDIC